MKITIHVTDTGYDLGPGLNERTIELTDAQYAQLTYYYAKNEFYLGLLERLYKEAVV